jgi:hypothetical protein
MLLCTAASTSPVEKVAVGHGAFVDGSSWWPVYDLLVEDRIFRNRNKSLQRSRSRYDPLSRRQSKWQALQ